MTRNLPGVGRRRVAIVVVAAASLLMASPASAHSTLERSEPPNGGKVAVGRSTLTLWFSEPISVAGSRFGLRTLGGGTVPVTVAPSGAAGRQRVELGAPSLAKGTYLLEWRAVSLADGHPSNGSVEFGVGTRPVAAATANDGLPGVPGLVLRWLDLSAIMLVIGALVVSGRVLGSVIAGGDAAGRRARTIAALAAGIAVVAGAVTPLLRTPRGGSVEGWLDTTWATLTGTRWGHVWLLREYALVIAAIALGSWAARRSTSRRHVHVAVVAVAAAVGLDAWAGHAASLPRQSGLAALASAAHLAAAGVWAGGAVALALCVVPAIRRYPGSRGGTLVAIGQTFSPIAAIATAVLLATGLYESGRHLPDLGSVGTTVYGDAVAAKVGLLALALILAAFNTLIVNPGLAASLGPRLGQPSGWAPIAARHFPAVLAAEVAVIVVSVMAAAVLTSVPTAREVAAATTQTAPSAANVDGLFVTFEAVPAGTGQSRLIVRTREIVRPPPAPIAGVDVQLTGPAGTRPGLSLAEVEPGRYEADASALASGSWQASVAVQRDGLPDAVLRAGWSVPAAAGADVGRLESTTTALAALLRAAAAAAASFARLRRHRRTRWIPSVDKQPGRRR
jgi:copper transport protein